MTTPSEREALDLILADWKSEIHTSFPAQVLAYDRAAQTVDIRPAIMRSLSNSDPQALIEYEKFPDMFAVPIQWPRAGGTGGFAITLPLAVGDWVHVHCAENALHVWRQRGIAPSPPGINDEHGLNGCVAVPGCFPDKEKLTNVSPDKLEIRSVDGSIKISLDPTTITLGAESGAQFVALADLVQSAVDAAIAGHSHATDGAPGTYTLPLTGCPDVAATMVKAK